ncbi:glycosyltransferase family 2 protein [Opitutus sp. ER46]|uniref:glycosyltransferase family 2 protein n=1 Tax=Opitutus sp. ER46 TaxID=2161864 RepID=UPI000D321FA8|nr:glycosyltransferase family 2 protein [Opitutus sp. ER46]PTY00081.1 glycosyl transferase family 2 [Opitutus sp. ER46]
MSAPRVSILLPAYQAAGTLARAIASIREQTLSDWELLVVDDGSTDGTAELVRGAAATDARVRLLGQPHAGLVAALTRGLAEARGELIARMDADDESHPERLAAQVAALMADPALGLVGCQVEFGGDAQASAGYALHVAWLNGLLTPQEIALNRFIEAPFAHPSVMFRREIAARHGGYRDGDFPEDYELWLRWSDAGVRMGKVPRPLLRWNDGPTRLSRADPRYAPEKFFAVKAGWLAREINRHPGLPVWIWGAGRHTRKRAAHLGAHGIAIAGYIDVDAKKAGHVVGGVPVISPAELPPPGSRLILGYVSNRGAREYIREQLTATGHVEGRDFLMCA